MQTAANLWFGVSILSLLLVGIYIADIEFWAWRERKRQAKERQADGYSRLLEDLLVGNEIDPRIEALVFKTTQGSTLQWHVPGATDADIVNHITTSSLFKRIA